MKLLDSDKENVPSEAWNLFESAQLDELAGLISSAKDKYEKAVEIHPIFEAGWISLAMAYKDLGNTVVAQVKAEMGLSHLPESSALWTVVGNCYLGIQHMEALAEEAFRKAVTFQPDNSVAVLNLSSVLADQGKFEEAEQILVESRKEDVKDEHFEESKELASHIWASLGLIRAELGKPEESQLACEKALEIDKNPACKATVAKAYAILGEMGDAEKHMPNDAEVWYKNGLGLRSKGLHDRALVAFEKALQIDSSRDDVRVSMAVLYINTQQYDEALAILKPLADADSKDHLVWYNLSQALLALGKEADAEPTLKRTIDLKSDYSQAWHSLAVLYDRQRRLQESETAYRKTVELDPENHGAWGDLGILLTELGRNKEAEAPMRMAIKQTKNVLPWTNLGIYLAKDNRCKEAKEILQQAQKIDPQNPRVMQLAMILIKYCSGSRGGF